MRIVLAFVAASFVASARAESPNAATVSLGIGSAYAGAGVQLGLQHGPFGGFVSLWPLGMLDRELSVAVGARWVRDATSGPFVTLEGMVDQRDFLTSVVSANAGWRFDFSRFFLDAGIGYGVNKVTGDRWRPGVLRGRYVALLPDVQLGVGLVL